MRLVFVLLFLCYVCMESNGYRISMCVVGSVRCAIIVR